MEIGNDFEPYHVGATGLIERLEVVEFMDERKVALKGRTKAFASAVVRFYIGLDKSREEIRVLGKQLLRAGTSVAANYSAREISQ